MVPSAASLAISLLGHARFTCNGSSHKFSAPPRTLPLLATLLLNRGTYLMRDGVAFTLWPDDTEEAARTNLRRHLNYLKNALPASATPWFVADAESVTWNDDSSIWFDVDAFRSQIDRPETMAEAIGYYTGEFLAGYYDDWLIVVRERLRSQYLGALQTLLVAARARRDFALAADFARRILGEDAWREDALRHLMAVRYESGDRTGALQEFEQFARRLHDDAGIEPMPETIVLRDVVLRGAALPESSNFRDDDGATDSGAASFPFVGRGAQLAQLTTAWTRAARGRGSLVLIRGEAGTGKSRLVSELALVATAQGARILRGATPSPEQRPFQAIASALRGAGPMLAALDLRPVWLRALAALLPEIEALRTDGDPLPALDAQREQTRLFEALFRTLSAIAGVRPTLLILEDLHWAGRSTLAAIEHSARRVGFHPLLIVGTYRSDEVGSGAELSAIRRRLAADGLLGSVALGGLAEEHVVELVAQILSLPTDASAEGRRIFNLSEGNALFVCELLRDRLEPQPARAEALTSLRGAIGARVSRLTDSARLVADAAAVIGASFDVDGVGDLVALDDGAVADGIGELLDRRLIREAGAGQFGFAFTHHLVQTTIYDALDERRRARWHARIAATLERLPREQRGELIAAIAHHYERSDQIGAAAVAYLEAAARALAIFANDEAVDLSSRALALGAVGTTRFELLLVREAANARRGDRAAQAGDVDELLTLAHASGDPEARCEATLRELRLARARSDIELEQRLADALLELATASGLHHRMGQALAERATAARTANRYDEAEAFARRALEEYHAIGDDAGAFECSCLLLEIASGRGSARDMKQLVAELRTTALHATNTALVARSTMAASVALMLQRDYDTAQDLAFRAVELYREMGDREGEAGALGRYASLLAVSGALDQSRREHQAAASIYRELGKDLLLGHLLFNLSVTEMLLGRLDVTQGLVADAERIFDRLGEARARAYCWVNLSTVFQLRGDGEEACRYALRALEAGRAMGNEVIEATALANLGNAERSLGDFTAAIGHMKEALTLGERMNHPAAVEELANLALAYLESGDIAAALEAARPALGQAATLGDNEAWRQYSLWIAARVFRAAGQERDATSALQRAHRHLQSVLERIDDAEARASFLALPMNAAIVAAVESGVWPP
jgi:DNA-binding SARP family transcriptional activator/tetratricopeptide (TPR) repeat protein